MKNEKGFTLIEFLLVSGIVAVLLGLGTISLMNVQHKSQLTATVDTFIADMKEQQIKAMAGDAESSAASADYGISIASATYTSFRTALGTSNFAVSWPSTIRATSTFPNSQIIFTRGSGELSGYTSSASARVTLQDTVDGTQKVIQLNRLGVISSIN